MTLKPNNGVAETSGDQFRYATVIDLIKRRIAVGHLRPGDKLPSLRSMARETAFSIITVHRAYELLESEGVCMARERSGFFVKGASDGVGNTRSEQANAPTVPSLRRISGMSEALLRYWNPRHAGHFGAFIPDKALFRQDILDKFHRSVIRFGRNHSEFGQPPGERKLKFQVAKRAAQRRIFVSADQVVITRSGTSGLNLCLDVLTRPGDVVLVESPSYFPMLSSLDRRRLKAVEIFSSPQAGIDCAQFRHLVAEHRPKVCILTVTNRFPTGTSYSEDVLKSLVQIAVEFETLIVENDMFSELSYDGNSRCLKQFDANDTVVQFSSFANFIAPEYGLGWVVAGKYAGDMEAVQFTNGLQGNDAAMQQAIADYLNSHSHDRQLRRVRRLLVERMREGLALVKSAFPASVQVSKPSGGYMCWLRLPKQLSSMALLDHPDLRDSKFLPGPMFSVAAGFSNYIALNFSGEWTPGRRRALQDLGRLVADLSARPL